MNQPVPSPARQTNGQFPPGHTGRPRGARNRAPARFVASFFEDFETHKNDLLSRSRNAQPIGDYLKFLGGLLPRQVESVTTASEIFSDEEIAQLIAQMRAILNSGMDGRGMVRQLESLLLD